MVNLELAEMPEFWLNETFFKRITLKPLKETFFCLFSRPLKTAEPKFAQAHMKDTEVENLNFNPLSIHKSDSS